MSQAIGSALYIYIYINLPNIEYQLLLLREPVKICKEVKLNWGEKP